jgi:hypothetical protein
MGICASLGPLPRPRLRIGFVPDVKAPWRIELAQRSRRQGREGLNAGGVGPDASDCADLRRAIRQRLPRHLGLDFLLLHASSGILARGIVPRHACHGPQWVGVNWWGGCAGRRRCS